MGTVVLRNVWKHYGNVEAVKDLNLTCNEGEFLALLGPSGCGKSSTLRMIAGLEKATQGVITIDGEVVNDLEPRHRDIAMAFESYALYPHLTAYENIAFPLRIRGMSNSEVDKHVREITDMLSISDALTSLPRNLSGGQQQRISFARAMVRPARVYLMDEPLSHLDAKQRSQLRSELKRLHQLKGLTIIFVTHDQIEAMAMADRIAVMNKGVLQQVATPREVFSKPANLFVADFVGEPPMNLLDVNVERDGSGVALKGSGFAIRISDKRLADAASRAIGSRAVFGVRPMHVQSERAGQSCGDLTARVLAFEGLGDTAIITLQLNGSMVRVETTPDDSANPGEDLGLKIDPRHMHLFDQETGVNMFC
ncbi:MAG: ABC transporter ATP-binding protein [Clostridia bacterium]|nr:ABC transporter ATP-binding protein [Clostridia bacterium]